MTSPILFILQAQESSNSNLNGVDVEDGVSQASGGSNSPISSQGITPTPTPTHRPTKLLFDVCFIGNLMKLCNSCDQICTNLYLFSFRLTTSFAWDRLWLSFLPFE